MEITIIREAGFRISSVKAVSMYAAGEVFRGCVQNALAGMVNLQVGTKRLRYKLGDTAGREPFILRPPSSGRCPGA